ncbi:hypothetical protein BGW37DRAFT_285625 [Umbelopsis sp. PMI_123]|nr:hypothetical protein BGW37DRAFT_285625 [Umbelopsis sp. PMI_123]
MVQIKRYTRRIRKEVMPAKTWVTSFGRTSKAPSKIIEPPIKVKRKTRLTNIVIPKGKGIPLWKIKGVLQNINQMSTLDIRALHKLLFHEIANKKESIYHILDFNGFEKPSTKIVLRSAMSKYNIRFLKRACKLFSLPARKEKAALVDMLIDFFHIPYQPIKYQPTRQFIYHVILSQMPRIHMNETMLTLYCRHVLTTQSHSKVSFQYSYIQTPLRRSRKKLSNKKNSRTVHLLNGLFQWYPLTLS